MRFWHVKPEDDRFGNSASWQMSGQLGRLQFGYHVYKHTSPVASDRWVFQPWFTYDRKDRREHST